VLLFAIVLQYGLQERLAVCAPEEQPQAREASPVKLDGLVRQDVPVARIAQDQ
jgi:hypothetical protein